MANKTRKDKKGYALRTGECQRKDGRYLFSYTDRWKKVMARPKKNGTYLNVCIETPIYERLEAPL